MKSENAPRIPDLFPPIDPRASGYLDVGDGHQVYWEEAGTPQGLPVLFLHGGPGAGCVGVHRRFFNPRRYRIVLFDQRGCGRSRPHGETQHNSTQDLIADIERLRNHLSIDQWVIFGGSWGSTLGIAYGEAQPDRCFGFILRGIFLGETHEVDWFLDGMGRIWPEAHRAFLDFLTAGERADPLTHYYRRLMDPDPAVHGPAARMWSAYETSCSALIPRHNPRDPGAFAGSMSATSALALARLEAHYFVNDLFVEEGQLMKHLARIRHLPCSVIQGRYDMVCPIRSADRLVEAWPAAELIVVPDAGHSALEPGIRSGLVAAAERMADRLLAATETPSQT